jgi:hypothetical protein
MGRGSPAPELHGHQRVERYAARVQRALLFRASQQCPGRRGCQARATSAFDVHCHASRVTLQLVRAEEMDMPQGQEPHVFSMASWKLGQGNERLLEVFMEPLALDPTGVKNHACYDELSTYGALAV